MGKELLVNVTAGEKRVAYLENGVVSEFYCERTRDRGLAGNIYKGKVQRVLPGMQAAFVEIGLEKASFLYVGDVNEELGDVDSGDERENKPRRNWRDTQIQDLLKSGQEVLVQVARGPIGTKGARVTSHISLPGRSVVYMPTWDKVGTSRRIGNDTERRRLRSLVRSMQPEYGGFIIRTAAEGLTDEMIKADMEYLISTWNEILQKKNRQSAPSLIHTELDVVLKLLRDAFSFEIERILIDDREEYENVLSFVERFMPRAAACVQHYESAEPLFDLYGIEAEINRALGNKVWLKSGGYLIIDQTEALTTIDVNTGKFVGKSSLEDTILKTNLEAVEEIGYQARLRNMGGIIILDFIDMERRHSQEQVTSALREVLKQDRAKTTISRITELGLIEMTRKRTHESLTRVLCESCDICGGKGYHKSKETMAYEILRQIQREALEGYDMQLKVVAHPSVCCMLTGELQNAVQALTQTLKIKVNIEPDLEFNPEQYEVYPDRAQMKGLTRRG